MNQTRRVFTTEFKQECVRLVIDQGYGVEQAAKAMSVGSFIHAALASAVSPRNTWYYPVSKSNLTRATTYSSP